MSASRLEHDFGVPPDLIDDLVLANRILAQHQVLDTFGHVSIRCNRNGHRGGDGEGLFLLATYNAPAYVGRDDIAIYRVSTGEPAEEIEKRKGALERHIHAAIYRTRVDVQAVLHCHSPLLVSFSILPPGACDLKPVIHVGASAGPSIPTYGIAHRNGDHTNLLVNTPDLGDDFAVFIRPCRRESGAENGFDARGIYAVVNAGIYKDALLMSRITLSEGPRALSEGEIEACGAEVSAVARSWPAWVSALGTDNGLRKPELQVLSETMAPAT